MKQVRLYNQKLNERIVRPFMNLLNISTVIQWLNKQLTFAQSRDPGLRLGPPPDIMATSSPLTFHLRDSMLQTPDKSSEKEK